MLIKTLSNISNLKQCHVAKILLKLSNELNVMVTYNICSESCSISGNYDISFNNCMIWVKQLKVFFSAIIYIDQATLQPINS